LAEKREGKPIYERLYELNKELLEKKSIMKEQEENRYRQSIIESQIHKRENLEQILYEDAERRRKDNEKAKAELDRIRDTPQGKPYHNEKSDKYVQKRFDRELKAAWEELL
jgi:hypothetical protein